METEGNCIWKVSADDRRCEFCSYRGGCERYPAVEGVNTGPSPLFDTYVDIMRDIVGESILERRRQSRLVYARYIVAHQLSLDNYGVSAISRMLHLHHSTVIYAIKKVKYMLKEPNMFPEECKILNNFKNRVKDVKET